MTIRAGIDSTSLDRRSLSVAAVALSTRPFRATVVTVPDLISVISIPAPMSSAHGRQAELAARTDRKQPGQPAQVEQALRLAVAPAEREPASPCLDLLLDRQQRPESRAADVFETAQVEQHAGRACADPARQALPDPARDGAVEPAADGDDQHAVLVAFRENHLALASRRIGAVRSLDQG